MSETNSVVIDYFNINSEEIKLKTILDEGFEGNDSNIDDSATNGPGSGGNGAGNTIDGDDQPGNLAHIPEDVYAPVFLEDYLKGLELPNRIDKKFFLKVGEDALKYKIADVEESNMGNGASKQRVPNKLEFDEVAVILMSILTFRSIQTTERIEDTLLAVYDDSPNSPMRGTYNTNKEYFYEIMERLAPKFKRKDMDDVLDKIKRSVPTVEQTKERHLFAVNNGIYNQKTKELIPFHPKYVYLTKITVDYKSHPINPVLPAPDGYQWDVESWIRDLTNNDDDTTTLLWQVIADCLQPNYSRHKSIWFYSEKGNNGKGTVGQLIKNLLGKGNYSSLSVADFNHEFLKSTLLGVAANIADENDVNMFIDSVKDYKASVTGDDININIKYGQPLPIQFNGTNIQMMNGLPKTKDKSESFYRRIILVPFLKSFTNNGERKYIKSDYINRKAVLEYVLHKALSIEFDEYIVPMKSAELLASYKEKNNPVMEFWNELKDEFVWDLLPTDFLYAMYEKWSEINNPSGKVMGKHTFKDTLSNVIVTQGDQWVDKSASTDSATSSNGKMDDDEPLITAYGLDKPYKNGKPNPWCSDYNGTNNQKKREFTRLSRYRGYVRA